MEGYDGFNDELEFNSEPYSPSQENSPSTLTQDERVQRQDSPNDTSVSQAVSTAFQENMRPLGKDIEDKLNCFRQEILGQDIKGTM